MSGELVSLIENGLSLDIAGYLAVAAALDRRVGLIEHSSPAPAQTENSRSEDGDKHLKILLDNLFSYVALLDIDGIVQEVNQAPLVRAGYRYEDVIGQYFHDAPWWSYDLAVQSQLMEAIEAARRGKISRYDVVVQMGVELTPIDFQISPAYDRNGHMFGLLATAVDISERKRVEEEKDHINSLAYNDMLTGLPNRRLFHDRLEQEIKKTERGDAATVLMLIDIDHFKEINDTLGHEIGDALLKEAANRILVCLRDYDTAARMGGDEFSVILSEVVNFADIQRIAQCIIDSLSREFVVMGRTIFASASAGLAVCPDDAIDSSDLIRYADQALYQAKYDGRRRFNFFTKSMQEASQRRSYLASELRYALKKNQLAVYYQPIVDLSTGRVKKGESLLRWKHPKHGFIPPDAFIPIAEETGIIHEIGDWVFEQAVAEAKRCCAITGSKFQISVNKSPVQFRAKSQDYDLWLDKLKKMDLPGSNIVIEITEGLMMNNDSAIIERFIQYRDAGIQIAIDDFGTGYSSLAYLKKFDIDYLKIDQSFIHNLAAGSADVALSEAIVVMAHKLELAVIAEGVETEEQLTLLRKIGCDFGQGYLFSPPVPAEEFEALLTRKYRRHHRRLRSTNKAGSP